MFTGDLPRSNLPGHLPLGQYLPRGDLDDRQGQLRVYYAGYIVLAAVLIGLHPFFFIFPVAAFFQAYLLKPPPVTFAAVLAASLVVNSLIVRDAPSTQNLWIFGVVVTIRTPAARRRSSSRATRRGGA